MKIYTDLFKMLKIVKFLTIGVEYEGTGYQEIDGILATKKLTTINKGKLIS